MRADGVLVVLRGNSGSGKTTTARIVREEAIRRGIAAKAALVEQDYLRRIVLRQREGSGPENIDLIQSTVEFALQRGYLVVLEGMLVAERYEPMLQLLADAAPSSWFHYLDVPFEETLRRHQTKPDAHAFGEAEMRQWYRERDLLGFVAEDVVPESMSQCELVEHILSKLAVAELAARREPHLTMPVRATVTKERSACLLPPEPAHRSSASRSDGRSRRAPMARFEGGGEARWLDRLGGLRNVVRQEVIARQLRDHVEPGMTVLDAGCGQGTQAIGLAALGCSVTGVDPSDALLERCRTDAAAAGVDIELLSGTIQELPDRVAATRYDLVCAHGLLMYLDDRAAALEALTERLETGGRLSVTFRNGDALALRSGLRGDWDGALAAFDRDVYVNELGVPARADRLADVEADLARLGRRIDAWYGVRVLSDAVGADTPAPQGEELAELLDAEERAGRTDPYRHIASQLHLIVV
jgi:S-adenosylmethionine-dependent methyltransferase